MSMETVNPVLQGHWRDYLALCKLKVVSLIVFTAVVGALLAVPYGLPPLDLLFFACLGIALAAASAAVVNHVVDRRIDSLMARTLRRPLPQGRVHIPQAIAFAMLLAALSTVILVFWVNTLTATLTLLSLVGYGFVYSMFLKRATPQNIVIGGAAGAAPPVLGWSAITGTLDPNALLLFLIVFVWTPPHFWALAIYRRAEYANADIPMLPVTHGSDFTRLHILLYTILLCLICLLPWLVRMSGLIYLICSTALNIGFLYYAIRMQFDKSERFAMRTFVYSIWHLSALFGVLLVDHYVLLLIL